MCNVRPSRQQGREGKGECADEGEDEITSAQATVQEESGSDCSHGVATPLAAEKHSGFRDNMMSGIRKSRELVGRQQARNPKLA